MEKKIKVGLEIRESFHAAMKLMALERNLKLYQITDELLERALGESPRFEPCFLRPYYVSLLPSLFLGNVYARSLARPPRKQNRLRQPPGNGASDGALNPRLTPATLA